MTLRYGFIITVYWTYGTTSFSIQLKGTTTGSIHHYSRASIPMLLFLSFGAELRGRLKVQIVSDSGSILFQSLHIEAYPFLGHFQVVVVEVDVEQIDVPRHFDRIQDVGLHNFPSNGQGGCLGVIVYVFVFSLLQFFVFFR